jgi:signal transduction histidine kinase
MRPVDLSALLKDICEDIEILAEPKQISVTTSIASYMMVNGDKTRLHQALLNVIENAVKYTPRGGRVKVTLTSDPRRALIRIEDTGQGIPAEQLPKIYDRFFRVDKARSQDVQGTGLGLSIVRWIVESHGGSIMASSEVGVGTTFVIALPLA